MSFRGRTKYPANRAVQVGVDAPSIDGSQTVLAGRG